MHLIQARKKNAVRGLTTVDFIKKESTMRSSRIKGSEQERFLFYVVNVRSHLREKRPLIPSKNNAA